MSVLDRSALSDSPLADLHAIASELSIDSYRRLRRDDLIQAILDKQGVVDDGAPAEATPASTDAAPTDAAPTDAARTDPPPADDDEGAGRRRRRRGGRARAGRTGEDDGAEQTTDRTEAEPASAAGSASAPTDRDGAPDESTPKPRSRRGRGGRGARDEAPAPVAAEAEPEAAAGTSGDSRARGGTGARGDSGTRGDSRGDAGARADSGAEAEETAVEGVVELIGNGSGFLRVKGTEPSDDDVYISAAQVKRCELVSGDRISGPKRPPRRSERFASLIRIETINGLPASAVADTVRFDDLPATFPTERIVIGSDDPTLEAIEWLTPFGRGSRVTIVGGARAGKSEALRRLAAALAGSEELTLSVALAGVRPEEISQWGSASTEEPSLPVPAAAVSFAASEEATGALVEPVIDQARRLAARGAHAVVLVDSLDGLHRHAARRLMASARNIVDGGSVTVIATASQPIGGETTVIALDASLTGIGRFPALDLLASGTLRPELLVGEAGAEAITRTRAEVLHGEDSED